MTTLLAMMSVGLAVLGAFRLASAIGDSAKARQLLKKAHLL
jgi:hypothetical protein